MNEKEKDIEGYIYDFWDAKVNERRDQADKFCSDLKQLHANKAPLAVQQALIKENFGAVGRDAYVAPGFACDNGKNIFVGDQFLTNFNVTILDIVPVHIGDYVMIGPNTLITTVNHPISTKERRAHLAIAKPVIIGNDVWIGGNVVILPGVTIGNNVVIAAGAVVNKDVPDNCIAGGVPCKKIKDIPNDTL